MIKALLLGMFLVGTQSVTGEVIPSGEKKTEATKATFLITGLHCPPCTKTVESSLSKVQGIEFISVDWKTKNAKLEFDENEISAQAIAERIHSTEHMMGGDLEYLGWLALKVPDMADEEGGNKVKEALKEVTGVKSVAVFLPQKAIGVRFEDEGSLTSAQLIEELDKAGIKASNF